MGEVISSLLTLFLVSGITGTIVEMLLHLLHRNSRFIAKAKEYVAKNISKSVRYAIIVITCVIFGIGFYSYGLTDSIIGGIAAGIVIGTLTYFNNAVADGEDNRSHRLSSEKKMLLSGMCMEFLALCFVGTFVMAKIPVPVFVPILFVIGIVFVAAGMVTLQRKKSIAERISQ